jgi:carbamoyltransferase
MAYTAYGAADEGLVAGMQAAYDRATAAVAPAERALSDMELGEPLGREILDRVVAESRGLGGRPEDMIASWHVFLERMLLEGLGRLLAAHRLDRPRFCFAGGCALNIKWNRALRASGLFEEMWVPPFPNDAGSAIGTACCAMYLREGRRRLEWNVYSGPALRGSVPGPGWASAPCGVRELARLLHEGGEPVVVLDGRAELGPRALGNRSILAPAVDPAMTGILNTIKRRESYRPIAPICIESRAPVVFDPGIPDPYMLYDHDVRPDWRARIPAVCHKDGTARIQTFSQADHPLIHALLTEYEQLSGVPVLCNTSANDNGSGFFPDVASAMRWGGVGRIWSDQVLYART